MPSIYVKLDVNYPDDPAFIEAGEAAEILFLRMLCLCKRRLSDGFVSDSQVSRFGLRRTTERLERLTKVRLIVRDDDRCGWVIPSWLKHNKTKAEVDELSEKRRLAGEMGGRPKATGNQSALGGGKQSDNQTENPETETSREEAETRFVAFWDAYPLHRENGKRGGGASKHETQKRFAKLEPEEQNHCVVAVKNYAVDCNRPNGTIPAHATTWLNQRRWEDWLEPGNVVRLSNGQPSPSSRYTYTDGSPVV